MEFDDLISGVMPFVRPIVGVAIEYLKNRAAPVAADKAVETLSEKAVDAGTTAGKRALELLRSWFQKKGDPKAQTALELIEQDPEDDDYRQKLVKETARLAATDPAFVHDLKVLAQQVTIMMPGSQVTHITSNAPNSVLAHHIDSVYINPTPLVSTRPVNELLRDYLGRLWQSCNALAFGDPQAGKPGQTMEMAQIFTMLRVQAEEMKEYAVIEALSRQRSCVLLGVPGGGKSTVVAFLALALAEAQPEFPRMDPN